MFKVLAPGSRKRRTWSAGTIAASVAAHVLVLGGAAYASLHASPPPRVEVFQDLPLPPPAPEPLKPKDPTPPPPSKPDEPPARAGQTVELRAPDVVPTIIPKVDPTEQPLHASETTGIGIPGDKYDPNATQPAAGGSHGNGDGQPTDVVTPEDLGEIPSLANRGEVQRVLQRYYPPMQRDAGIAGDAQLQFVINTDGSVDAASVKVVSSTSEAFGEAAKRAVERFRFRPATMMGEPVRVLITIPIRFTVAPGA